MNDKREVLLVDLSGLLHPAWRVAENQPIGVIFDATVGGVHRCVAKFPGALVAICLDSKKNWRKELDPNYKSSRDKMPNAFYDCARRVEERLTADGFLLWRAEGFEADDVIATATLAAVAAGHDVTVCSTDKDLAALLRTGPPSVRQMKLSTFEFVTAESFTAKSGLRPDQVGDFLALTGDKSDDVKGVEGVGATHAADALKQWDNLIALGAALESDPGACGRKKATKKGEVGEPFEWTKGILSSWAQLENSRKLVELRYDVPLKFDEIYQDRVVQKLVKVEDEPMPEESISAGPGNVTKAQEVFNVEAKTDQTPDVMPTVGLPFLLSEPTATKATEMQTGDSALAGLLQKEFVPREYELALEPRDPSGAVRLSLRLLNSRLFMQYGNEDAILAVITRARAMGIPAVAALNCFHVVDGPAGKMLTPYAYLMVHLASKDPSCEYILPVEASPTSATWETKHRKFPKPFRLTYTIEQAEIAGLNKPTANGKPSNWMKNPEDMLVARCGAKMSRRYYSGAVMGLVAFEEMGGDE